MQRTDRKVVTNQSGFTLIELIIVIVILGLLSVVAIPKYVDMRKQAATATANGVFGAAQAAAAINFAAGLAGATQPAGGRIVNSTGLVMAMDGKPDGWEAPPDTRQLQADIAGKRYIITVQAAETATAKAVLIKNW